MKHLTDQELMSIVQAGDPSPAAEIYDRYSKGIYNFTRGFLRNDVLAADTTQEVFLKMLRHAPLYKGGSSLSGWLYTIARNCCRDHFRRAENKAAPELEDVLVEMPSEMFGSPDRGIEQVWNAKLVEEALASLLPDNREIILLFRYREMSHADIARVVGCSISAIKARIFRSMDLMRRFVTRRLSPEPAVEAEEVVTPAATPVEDPNV